MAPPLFKFVGASRLISLLQSPKVRFTQPTELNDPFECHLTMLPDDIIAQHLVVQGGKNSKNVYFKSNTPDLDEGEVISRELLLYRERRRQLGVMSLTEDPENLLMWAHYGDQHRGAVVELDVSHPSFALPTPANLNPPSLLKVLYTDKKIVGLPDAETLLSVLSTKSTDWAYEKEWRLIRSLTEIPEDSPGVHLVDIDRSAIKKVFLGARFDLEKLELIAEQLTAGAQKAPPILMMRVHPTEFKLMPTPLDEVLLHLIHGEMHFGEACDEALACLRLA